MPIQSITQYAGAVGSPNAWTNPLNAVGSGESSCAMGDPTGIISGEWESFGFALGSDAVIVGIQIEIKVSSDGVDETWFVQLLKNGSPVGNINNQFGGSAAACGASQAVRSLGGSTNLWGTTWTASDINASGFGTEVEAQGFTTTEARLNWIRATVYYATESVDLRELLSRPFRRVYRTRSSKAEIR